MYRFLIPAALGLLLVSPALACDGGFPLDGSTVRLPGCGALSDTCLSGEGLLRRCAQADDNDAATLSVGIQSSPWRFYDGDYRIMSVAALADLIKPAVTPEVRRILLQSSWAGFTPPGASRSLAVQMADHFGGLTVTAPQGFVWVAADGSLRVTQQSFTAVTGGLYTARPGEDVMEAAALFVSPQLEEDQPTEGRPLFWLRQGISEDVFNLCPDQALAKFEQAAEGGNTIGAYNAAVMLLEHSDAASRQQAKALLARAAAAGDRPAAALLATLAD